MATEYEQIENAQEFLLHGVQFNLNKWLERQIGDDEIYCQFLKFLTVLNLSHPSVRKKHKISKIEVPKTSSSLDLIRYLTEQLRNTPYNNTWGGQELIMNSHLLIPYIFPHILSVLSAVDLLSSEGLKGLGLLAVENREATVDEVVRKNILDNIPKGNFKNKEETISFLAYFADNLRESYSKTEAVDDSVSGNFPKKFDILTTQDSKIQQSVLDSLITWFKPKEIPNLNTVENLFKKKYKPEKPEEYIKRKTQQQGYNRLIYQSLQRT